MKTVIVKGSRGSNLVKQLLVEGYEVTVLDNHLSGYRSNRDPFPEVRFIDGDICDEAEVADAMKCVDAVCLRYFNVYGPNQHFDTDGNVILLFVFKMLRGKPITVFDDGMQTRDFRNLRNVVRANIRAVMRRGVSGAFNAGSGRKTTIDPLVKLLQDASVIDPLVEHGPPIFGDVRDCLAFVSAARTVFGFDPCVSLEEGIPKYIAWTKKEVCNSSA